MKPIKPLLVLAAILVPAVASAQGYYGRGGGGYYSAPPQTAPGGFHARAGRMTLGGSLGLGGMHDRGGDIECGNCNYNPLSGQIEGHIGGMLSHRFALMFEAQGNVQTLSVSRFPEDDLTLVQTAWMAAAQYWATPQLWLKGGIGLAHLSVDDAYYTEPIDNGTALLGAIGYEVFSARNMAIEIQGRLLSGFYRGTDNQVTALSVGVGLNLY
jgi:hypothetical protein